MTPHFTLAEALKSSTATQRGIALGFSASGKTVATGSAAQGRFCLS